MAEFIKAADVGDVPEGEGKALTVGGSEIALFHLDGQFHAIDGRCAHRGGPLAEGHLEGNLVICPWHSWAYNVTSGANLDVPECPLRTFEVRVEGTSVLVRM